MSLARKSCSYLLLLPDEESLAQGSTLGSAWAADHSTARRTLGVIRCRTVRQLSAQERWDTEFALSIEGTPWSVWISLRLEVTEVRIRQKLTHQSSPGECASPGGLVSPPNVWVAVPFEQELGTLQTTLSAVAKGLSKNSRGSLKELPKSLATERE